jgi:hypothetical protein
MDRWRCYEEEWADNPYYEDMAAHHWGFHKAKTEVEIPMTQEEYFKKFPKK